MLVTFLWDNSDVFAWEEYGLPSVPREVIEHKLVDSKDAKPVKQVLRKQSKEKLEFIISEVDKLIEAGVIRAVPHPTWVANPEVVPKPMTFKWQLCIDLTDLNKACIKDPFPLPWIDLIIDSPARCELL